MQPIMMTEEQWAEYDKKNAERQQAERLASGLANGLSWRKDPMDQASPSLEITADGVVSISIQGLSISKPIAEWHKLALAQVTQGVTEKQVPNVTETLQEALRDILPPNPSAVEVVSPKKLGRPAKAQQTASV